MPHPSLTPLIIVFVILITTFQKARHFFWIQTYRSMIFFLNFWQICRIIDRWFLIFGMCYRVKKRGWLTRIKNHINLFYEILNYFVLKIFKKKNTLTQLIIINESQLILVSNQVKLEIMLNREHFTWWHFFISGSVRFLLKNICEFGGGKKKSCDSFQIKVFFFLLFIYLILVRTWFLSALLDRFVFYMKKKIFILFCKTVLVWLLFSCKCFY